MPTGYTTVSATNLCDATGSLIANATIYFKPVDNKGNPISFRVGSTNNGQAVAEPVSTNVINGAFSIVLADMNLTAPINIGYAVTVIDNLTGNSLLGAGYGCVQWPTGTTFDFDTYAPNYAAQITVQYGPPGPQGIQGPPGAPGSGSGGTGITGDLTSLALADSTDGSTWIVTVTDGALTIARGSSSTSVSSVTFIDSVDSSTWQMTVVSGSLNLTKL